MADAVIVWRAWILCSDQRRVVLIIPVVMLGINAGAISSLFLTFFLPRRNLFPLCIYSSHLPYGGRVEGHRVQIDQYRHQSSQL